MIDLDALEASIAAGEKKNFFVAPIVKELIAELREARKERPAVVAWLRSDEPHRLWGAGWSGLWPDDPENSKYTCAADCIERGEHRREEKP